jgi:hypothetical protein
MTKLFSAALIAQTLCVVAFIIHRFVEPMGSDLMFIVLLISLLAGVYLLWQSFSNSQIQGFQKVLGILLGILPLIWLSVLVFFISNFSMH